MSIVDCPIGKLDEYTFSPRRFFISMEEIFSEHLTVNFPEEGLG
jgi:hypothetical protein